MEILKRIPQKNKHLAWRVIDQEAVIINLEGQSKDKEEISILNPTATRIWELCNGKHTIGQIISQLREEYARETNQLQPEVIKSINQMSAQKIISI